MRGVMVGCKGLTRDILKREFSRAGADAPTSFLATGNVIFDAATNEGPQIVRAAPQSLRSKVGLNQPMFSRSFPALKRLTMVDPFEKHRGHEAFEYWVSFLSRKCPPSLRLPHTSDRGDFTIVSARDNHVFSYTRLVKRTARQPNPMARTPNRKPGYDKKLANG